MPARFLLLLTSIVIWALVQPSSGTADALDRRLREFVERNPAPLQATVESRSSALQPLTVSWYDIPAEKGTGGAIADIGGVLFLVQRTGEISWVALTGPSGPYQIATNAPMNLDDLRVSGLTETPGFAPEAVRVTGAIAEPADDGVRLTVAHHVFDNGCFHMQVSSIELALDAAKGFSPGGDWKTLFRSEPCIRVGDADEHKFAGHQAGGRLAKLDSQYLVLSIGDHELHGPEQGTAPQDPNSAYGKIWRIARDGSSASILASGVRNPQGLLRDRDGRVWETEHGPRGGDELNRVVDGANFGWPIRTFGISYGTRDWPLSTEQGSHADPNFDAPVFAWMPSIAVSAIAQVDGPKFARWDGDLLVATLRDMSLRRLRFDGDRVAYDERIAIGERLRDIAMLDDGRLAMLTDSARLGLLDEAMRIAQPPTYDGVDDVLPGEATISKLLSDAPTVVAQPYETVSAGLSVGFDRSSRAVVEVRRIGDLDRRGDWAKAGEAIFATRCASCHAFERGELPGPPLADIVGRPIGAEAFSYSAALASPDAKWSEALLAAYLSDNYLAFPGGDMPRLELSAEDALQVLAHLGRKGGERVEFGSELLDVNVVNPSTSGWITLETGLGPIDAIGKPRRLVGIVRARAERPLTIGARIVLPTADGDVTIPVAELEMKPQFQSFVLTKELRHLPETLAGREARLVLFLPVEAGTRVQLNGAGAEMLSNGD